LEKWGSILAKFRHRSTFRDLPMAFPLRVKRHGHRK
jgi:hypothetical protein